MATPSALAPTAPINVTIFDKSVDRVVVDWALPNLADDTDLVDNEPSYFQVAIMKDSTAAPTAGTWYKADRYAAVTRHSFKLVDADLGHTFYGWVRSVDDDGDKSAWIPATIAGNSSSGATPSGILVQIAGGNTHTPAAPTNLYGEYDRIEGGRQNRIRAKLSWTEVSLDTDSPTPNTINISHYIVQMQHSGDGGSTWADGRRLVAALKDDTDPAGTFQVILKGIASRRQYRFRVRAVSREAVKGVWSSGWYSLGQPGAETVPAPINVTLIGKGKHHHGVELEWDAPYDPTDIDLFDERISHFGCEIALDSGFNTVIRRDISVKGQHRTFKIPDNYLETPLWGRVWTVTVDKDKSAKVAAPNSIEAHDSAHVGTIRKFSFGGVPKGGWLRCNGNAYPKSSYPDLNAYYAADGYPYGSTSTTFNTPDHRRRNARGAGSAQLLGDDGEAEDQRDPGHGKHPHHKHKHHHRVRHPKHDRHGTHDRVGVDHRHNAGGYVVSNDPTGAGVPRGTQNTMAAGPNHGHGQVTGDSGFAVDSSWDHGPKHDGDVGKQQNEGHGHHQDDQVLPDGPPSHLPRLIPRRHARRGDLGWRPLG